MINQDFVNKFKEIKDGKDEFVFRKVFSNVITFDEFVKYREESNITSRPTRWEYDFKLSLNFELDGSPILSNNKAFNDFRKNLYEVWGESLWDEPAIIMTTETGEGSGLGAHSDPCEQIHWNCVGTTLWTVYHDDGVENKYVLGPGDVIFLPDGMKHAVRTLTAPRAGMAYSIDNKNYRKNQKRGKYADL